MLPRGGNKRNSFAIKHENKSKYKLHSRVHFYYTTTVLLVRQHLFIT